MHNRSRTCLLGPLAVALLAGCAATTSFTPTPSPKPPVCHRSPQHLSAAVLWGTQWRADQKDVADRETAASQGIARFFQESACFAGAQVQRLSASAPAREQAAAMAGLSKHDVVLVVIVRELGPVLKVGASAALIDGGTEVVLDLSTYERGATTAARAFSAHWENGGPGVVKGVASLPADMESALAASLQPAAK
jgi:hypothetical protein